jgi:hypothetical protein
VSDTSVRYFGLSVKNTENGFAAIGLRISEVNRFLNQKSRPKPA